MMSSSDSEWSSCSSGSSHGESSTEDSDIVSVAVEPYRAEPEWTDEHLTARAALSSDDESGEGQEDDLDSYGLWPPPSRIGTTDWCTCGECCAMRTRLECVCCQARVAAFPARPESQRKAPQQCIPVHARRRVTHANHVLKELSTVFDCRRQLGRGWLDWIALRLRGSLAG